MLNLRGVHWRSSCSGLSSSLSYRNNQNCKNCANSRVRLKQLLGTFSLSINTHYCAYKQKESFTIILKPKIKIQFYILISREEFESTVRKIKIFLPAALEFFSCLSSIHSLTIFSISFILFPIYTYFFLLILFIFSTDSLYLLFYLIFIPIFFIYFF